MSPRCSRLCCWRALRRQPRAVTAAQSGWIEVGLAEIAAQQVNPPRAARALALVSVAMLDASRAPRWSRASAVGGAAVTVLSHLFPDRAHVFAGLVRGRARGPDGRSDSGWARVWSRAPVATAPTRSGARLCPRVRVSGSRRRPPSRRRSNRWWGNWRTWNIRSGSALRPGPPPAFGSRRWVRELREVYEVSRALTGEQQRIAERWADGPGTATPPGHWNSIALELIRSQRLPERQAARCSRP